MCEYVVVKRLNVDYEINRENGYLPVLPTIVNLLKTFSMF